jgi:hypothetical protein
MTHHTLLTTIALVVTLNMAAAAHHSSSAAYRLDTTEVIEGTVVMVAFKQPHTYLHVEATDREGINRRWSLQWADATVLVRDGVTRSTLRPGDRIRVVGYPGRNVNAYQMLVAAVTRPADGWSWTDESGTRMHVIPMRGCATEPEKSWFSRMRGASVSDYSASEPVLWTSTQLTREPAYPTLRIRIIQLEKTLSGSVRDDASGVDVLVSSGSIDETGNVRMTVALSNQGEPRQILIFEGRIDGSNGAQQIIGSYVALNPHERGTFLMSHD